MVNVVLVWKYCIPNNQIDYFLEIQNLCKERIETNKRYLNKRSI